MTPPFELAASGTFGLAAGILSGFLGIGGGAILPPLLVFVLGLEQHRAQGISLAALLPPVGLPAVLAYRKGGVHVSALLVTALVLGFLLGGLGGAWLAHRVPARELRWAFAAFLAASAWRAAGSVMRDEADRRVAQTPASAWVGAPIGLVAGLLSGLLGVGGGIVALPLLRRLGRLGRLEAQATTLAMLLPPIGLPAVYMYAKEQGGLPWHLLAAVAIGFACGAGIGAHGARLSNERLAAKIYATFLAVTAIALVLHP